MRITRTTKKQRTRAKPKKPKNKTFERMFGFDSKDVFLFSVVFVSFFGSEMEKQKTLGILVI